jgi:hypothetical protein
MKTQVIAFRADDSAISDIKIIEKFLNVNGATLGRARSAAVRHAVQRLAEQFRELDRGGA